MDRHCGTPFHEESHAAAAVRSPHSAILVKSAVLALVALALYACSGGAGRLKPETPAGVNLAGTWRLNRQASENPQAMIEAIRQKFMRGRRGDYVPPMTGEEMPEIDEHGDPRPRRRARDESGSQQGPSDPRAAERR